MVGIFPRPVLVRSDQGRPGHDEREDRDVPQCQTMDDMAGKQVLTSCNFGQKERCNGPRALLRTWRQRRHRAVLKTASPGRPVPAQCVKPLDAGTRTLALDPCLQDGSSCAHSQVHQVRNNGRTAQRRCASNTESGITVPDWPLHGRVCRPQCRPASVPVVSVVTKNTQWEQLQESR